MNYGGNQISLNSGNREKPSGTTSEAILGIIERCWDRPGFA